MLIVQVRIHVKPESVEAFRQATLANARQSILEPGAIRLSL
jgi:quinol monooxygenase YgiN